jgi:hypothetical protein
MSRKPCKPIFLASNCLKWGKRYATTIFRFFLLCLNVCINKVCQWLATGQWFSLGTPVSSINKTDRHDVTEILLKVALNTKTLTLNKANCIFFIYSFNSIAYLFPHFRQLDARKIGLRKPLTCCKSLTNFINADIEAK